MKDEFNFEIQTLKAALKEYLRVKYGTFEMLALDLDILWPWGTLEHKHAEIPVGSSDQEIAKQISIMRQGCMPYENFEKSIVEKLSVLEDGFTLYVYHELADAISHDNLAKIKTLIAEVNQRAFAVIKKSYDFDSFWNSAGITDEEKPLVIAMSADDLAQRKYLMERKKKRR